MNKLNDFQKKLPNINIISKTTASTIKGGIRYVTDSEEAFEQMMEKLNHYEMDYTTHFDGKVYCIDW